MKIIKQKFISRQDVHANPNYLYIFGDNFERCGMGGQAKEMRYCANSYGITTKRKAAHGHSNCYLWDEESDAWAIVNADFDVLEVLMRRYDAVVIPEDGIGTGLAKLQKTAPRLLAHINNRLENLKNL